MAQIKYIGTPVTAVEVVVYRFVASEPIRVGDYCKLDDAKARKARPDEGMYTRDYVAIDDLEIGERGEFIRVR